MTKFAADIMNEEIIYEARINIKRYARIIQNLSRIGNTKGANHYREKLSEQRRILRYSEELVDENMEEDYES